jgi:two-component system phosphate regulon sensor histidine kinase PhoR
MPEPSRRLRLAVESLIWAGPAAVALVLLAAVGLIGPLALLLGCAIAVGTGALIGHQRQAEMDDLVARIRALAAGSADPRPPAEGLFAADALVALGPLERQHDVYRRQLATLGELQNRLIEAMPDPVLLVDSRQIVRRANRAAQKGLDLPEAGVPLVRVIRDPALVAAIDAALAGGAGSSLSFAPPTDRRRRWAAQVEPIVLPDGDPGALIALREQSEQVVIERMRSDFIANASHELRTPLTSLRGFIETLQGPAKDDPAARDAFLAIMAGEAARMTRLIDDLLSLSRVEMAVHQPPTGRVAIAELVRAVAQAMEPQAARNGSSIAAVVDEHLPVIAGDEDQIHQLLGILLDNALKYGRPGQCVRIEAQLDEAAGIEAGPLSGRRAMRLTVADQGEGIAAEHLPRLTERFYRVDKGRSRQAGGTGLGLAIAKHILRRHRGHLSIASEIGVGSRFTVFLPA